MTSSDLAVWISGSSLLVSILALWRVGRGRALDLRTSALKDVAELRSTLGDLLEKIPPAVQSRRNVAAALGNTGATERFRGEADADSNEIQGLLTRLNDAAQTSAHAPYSDIEQMALTAREVRTRAQQLSEKYAAAWAQDEASREYLRRAAADRVNRR